MNLNENNEWEEISVTEYMKDCDKYEYKTEIDFESGVEVLANTIEKLSIAKTMSDATLKQINIHQVIYQENYIETIKLLDMIKDDERFKDLNAIVFLGLKKCGRAESGGFTPLSEKDFAHLIKETMIHKIGYGFDSCSAFKVSKYFNDKYLDIVERVGKEKEMKPQTAQIIIDKAHNDLEEVLQHIESCESGIMSFYSNVKGEYHNCSFQEHTPGCNLLTDNFQDYWENSDNIKNWRKMLKESNRSCPLYVV